MKNVAEYVALAKAKPGTLNYGHPGKGSTGHLGFELFKRLAGIDVNPIGYRGYPQMVADIASGLITSTFLSANQALALVQTRHDPHHRARSATAARNTFPMCRPWRSRALPRRR